MFYLYRLTVCPLSSNLRPRFRRSFACCLLLATSFQSPALLAQDGDLVQTVSSLQFRQQSLEQTIASLESSGDFWHPMLAESMTSLGQLLQEAGRHQEALTALERAAHVNRVNHGLYSLEQVPALALQIDSHIALNEWEQADRLMRDHFYIHVRALPEGSPQLIPALEKYAGWHLRAFVENRTPLRLTRLVDAWQLHRLIIKVLEDDPQHDPVMREHHLRQMAFVAWRMSRMFSTIPTSVLYDPSRQVNDVWVDYLAPDTFRVRNNTHVMGETALQMIVDSTKQRAETTGSRQAMQDYIRARLDLADWYMHADLRRKGALEYQAIWQEVTALDSNLASEIFNQVVIVPAYDYVLPAGLVGDTANISASVLRLTPSTSVRDHIEWPWVEIEFDMNRQGQVTRTAIVSSSTELEERARRRIQLAFRATRLRPMMADGETVGRDGVKQRFFYHPNFLGSEPDEEELDTEEQDQQTEAAEGVIETASTEAQ